jgi:type II secretory pathway pseudopilin PulG
MPDSVTLRHGVRLNFSGPALECLVEWVPAKRSARRRGDPGFTLLDVLVALGVITLLIAILTPTLGKVQETSRRVVCSSNLRQFGLGLQMYADDWRGQVPPSAFLNANGEDPAEMMTVRLPPEHRFRVNSQGWDGLGILYSANYFSTPGLYYCPSHSGDHPFERYADTWTRPAGEIVGNYHFRGQDADGLTNLYLMLGNSALAADGMRTQDDYSHRVGLNVLRAGGHVAWMDDPNGQIMGMLAIEDPGIDSENVEEAWNLIDRR